MYQRKTKDVYRLMCDYGCGEEVVLEEDTLKDAQRQVRSYRENQPEYSYWISKIRLPLEEETSND